MNNQEKKLLIIAGQPKAGTTSLFEWLRHHPSICASRLKESRFFLDDEYPLRRPLKFDGNNLEQYFELFEAPEREVMMEATPDYLYCEKPLQIARLLPKARIVVLLRDPMSRMISAYRFFQQRGLISADMSFDEYIAYQAVQPVKPDTPVQYRALDHCRTDYYLPRWRDAFQERLLVLDFNDLKGNSVGLISEVCRFLEIPDLNFRNQVFASENRTGRSRWPWASRIYYAMNRELSMIAMQRPLIRRTLRPLNRLVKKVLHTESSTKHIVASPETTNLINAWAGMKS